MVFKALLENLPKLGLQCKFLPPEGVLSNFSCENDNSCSSHKSISMKSKLFPTLRGRSNPLDQTFLNQKVELCLHVSLHSDLPVRVSHIPRTAM